MTLDVHAYLRQFQRGLSATDWPMADPDELIGLAQWYHVCGDDRSAYYCIYLFTALKHPPPQGYPTTVELGRAILEAWLKALT